MTGLDTNVLTRFILQDDSIQSLKADRIIASLSRENPGWVSLATLLELVWLLRSKMRLGRVEVVQILNQLLNIDVIHIQHSSTVVRAVENYRLGKADFPDCLISASGRAAGCSRTVTFDKIAARDAGMELIG